MTDLQSRADSLRGEWEVCKAQEDRKSALITDLFDALDVSQADSKGAKFDLEVLKDAMIVTRNRLDETIQRVRDLEHEKKRHAFVLVLIDGDSMPFRDELVRQGVEGGKRAASLLKQAVEDELRSSARVPAPHMQVMARVYANVKGLGKTYKDANVLPRSECLDEFIRGFNMGDALCDYVDAGIGKECSDEKVKAVFRSFISNVHCQRIYFGASADNGYARLLGPYLETPEACDRVCLLEGPPFARELNDIKHRLGTATFGDVFRDKKLPTLKRRVSWQTTPPATPSIDYATVASRPPSLPSPTAQHDSSPTVKILRNGAGQRVDSDLKFSSLDFQDLKLRKLCNRFHLTGRCPYQTNGRCYYEHGDRLAQRYRAALLAVSRLSPCIVGLGCDDPDCISGHRCARRDCHAENCLFPPEMHGVDAQVVG